MKRKNAGLNHCITGLLFVLFLGAGFSLQSPAAEEIDWQKFQEIRQKQQQGASLTAEEQAYLSYVNEWRRKRTEEFRATHTPRESTGLIPLTDPGTASHKTEQGGLYPEGKSQPPSPHLQAGTLMAQEILPRDRHGNPTSEGKIVLLSVGMSNTTQEFQAFQQVAATDPDINPQLVIVDGAQGGQAADVTANPRSGYWQVVNERLEKAGVTRQQVQAAWVKQATRVPYRPFPREVKQLQQYLLSTVQNLKQHLPNLKIAYLSSRTYAGYANTPLNPEPHAYESAFAVKWLIADQIDGKPELNYDPSTGPVRAPWLAWGPYLWADGVKGRSDGLVYRREDFARDGTHPSPSGRRKVAELLLSFFKEHPTARPWFLRQARSRSGEAAGAARTY